jgi:hypothetical protein
LPEQKLATYFKLKSPDSNSVPGVTQSFAAFRTYKYMDSSISKGTQCVHQDFSSYRGYRNLLAKRIHVRILGHAGRILRSYLHDLCDRDIQFFITTMRLEDHNFVMSLVWLFQYPRSSGCFLQLVANPSRWE